MSRSVERISRRAAMQRAAVASIGAAAGLFAAPAPLRASLLGVHALRGAERLLMVFCRDAALTGADELAFFHGSTTRLEPSLGAWVVHAMGPANAQVRGLQCVEWGPTTCAQRMAYSGELPNRCQGEAGSVFEHGITQGHGSGTVERLETIFERGARAVQTVLPCGSAFSLASYSRNQLAQPGQCLLVLAGTYERIQASMQEAWIPSELSAPVQLGHSALHVVLHGAAVHSRSGPETSGQGTSRRETSGQGTSRRETSGQGRERTPSVRAIDLHASVLAGMGLNARRLDHPLQGRTIRPLAAQGRAIPGGYAEATIAGRR